MTVYELNREQLIELKQDYLDQKNAEAGEGTSWGELAGADKLVTDEEVFLKYGSTEFTNDDFVCTAGTYDASERNILFNVGYYEWNIFVDDECVYSFGDLGEDFEGVGSKEEFSNIIDDLIYCMREEFKDNSDNFPLTNDEVNVLKTQMIAKLGYHYLDDKPFGKVDDLIAQASAVSKEGKNPADDLSKFKDKGFDRE